MSHLCLGPPLKCAKLKNTGSSNSRGLWGFMGLGKHILVYTPWLVGRGWNSQVVSLPASMPRKGSKSILNRSLKWREQGNASGLGSLQPADARTALKAPAKVVKEGHRRKQGKSLASRETLVTRNRSFHAAVHVTARSDHAAPSLPSLQAMPMKMRKSMRTPAILTEKQKIDRSCESRLGCRRCLRKTCQVQSPTSS